MEYSWIPVNCFCFWAANNSFENIAAPAMAIALFFKNVLLEAGIIKICCV
jgi:hypothetical protein